MDVLRGLEGHKIVSTKIFFRIRTDWMLENEFAKKARENERALNQGEAETDAGARAASEGHEEVRIHGPGNLFIESGGIVFERIFEVGRMARERPLRDVDGMEGLLGDSIDVALLQDRMTTDSKKSHKGREKYIK